jgi:hypothetical protein
MNKRYIKQIRSKIGHPVFRIIHQLCKKQKKIEYGKKEH